MIRDDELNQLAEKASSDGIQKMVVGACITSKGKFLIVKRAAAESFMAGLEEIPSGTVDPRETLGQALKREVREETGLNVRQIRKYVNSFDYTSGSGKKTRQFNFLVDADGIVALNSEEHSSYKWLHPESGDYKRANISQETRASILKANAILDKPWIAIDGIDATGKGTQIQLLSNRFNSIAPIGEFSSSEIGDLLRANIQRNQFLALEHDGGTVRTETALLVADMLYKSEHQLQETNLLSKIVVSDRGLLSLIAYQGCRLALAGLPSDQALKWVEGLVTSAFSEARKPDVNIVFTASIDEVESRCRKRGENLTLRDREFLSLAQDSIVQLASKPEHNGRIINVSGLTPPQLLAKVHRTIVRETGIRLAD